MIAKGAIAIASAASLTLASPAVGASLPEVVSFNWNGGSIEGTAGTKSVPADLHKKIEAYTGTANTIAVYCLRGKEPVRFLLVGGLFHKLGPASMKPSAFVTKKDGSNGYLVLPTFASPREQARGGTLGRAAKDLHQTLIKLAGTAC